jgi:hypothetical protein
VLRARPVVQRLVLDALEEHEHARDHVRRRGDVEARGGFVRSLRYEADRDMRVLEEGWEPVSVVCSAQDKKCKMRRTL